MNWKQFLLNLLTRIVWPDKEMKYLPIQTKYPEPLMPSTDNKITDVPIVPETLRWDTPKQAFHATRVTCDNMGLSVSDKNIICACIYQESQFNNEAVNHNKNSSGLITSTDWGIVQINDWYHIGPKKDFPSVSYVIDNPDKAVEYMIKCQKQGLLRLWVSYSSGAYQKWLLPSSPMWLLRK